MLDTEHILKDAGEVTSSGFGTVEAAASVLELGEGLVRGNVVIDISAIKISANDEKYVLHLIGGSDGSFTREVSLCSKELGANESLEGNLDSKISRIILPFQNEQNGEIFPYARIRHVISGTSPSINYAAHCEKDLPWYGVDFGYTTTTTTV